MYLKYLISKMPTLIRLVLAFFLLFNQNITYSQKNISGKSGLIYIPDAYERPVGTWSIGYQFNPKTFAFASKKVYPEQILYTSLDFTKKIQITFLLLQQRANAVLKPKIGIGDRQLDVRYQIFTENNKRPALALVLSSPFTISPAIQTTAIISSKTFKLKKVLLKSTVGFGSPYYVYRNEANQTNDNIFSKFKLQRKSLDGYKNNYLVGFFGGLNFEYKDRYDGMVEWDGQKVNIGVHARLLGKLYAQVGLLQGKSVTAGIYLEKSLYN